MFYMMKLKYAIFSNIKVTKSSVPLFWGDTRYTCTYKQTTVAGVSWLNGVNLRVVY